MKIFKTQFKLDDHEYHHTDGYSCSQAGDIDDGIIPVAD
jgi:hypothetical protein